MRNTKYLRSLLLFLLVAALVYVLGVALLSAWPMWSMMWQMMGMGSGPAVLALLIVIVGFVWLLSVLLRGDGRGESSGRTTLDEDSALAILRERYARGEITQEEYQRMRNDLTGVG